jgi:hypothetical protein
VRKSPTSLARTYAVAPALDCDGMMSPRSRRSRSMRSTSDLATFRASAPLSGPTRPIPANAICLRAMKRSVSSSSAAVSRCAGATDSAVA